MASHWSQIFGPFCPPRIRINTTFLSTKVRGAPCLVCPIQTQSDPFVFLSGLSVVFYYTVPSLRLSLLIFLSFFFLPLHNWRHHCSPDNIEPFLRTGSPLEHRLPTWSHHPNRYTWDFESPLFPSRALHIHDRSIREARRFGIILNPSALAGLLSLFSLPV